MPEEFFSLMFSLPEDIQDKALINYLYELGETGALSQAGEIFENLFQLPGHDTAKALATWHLMGCQIRRGDLRSAQKFFTYLERLEQSSDVLTIRAKALFNLVDALLATQPSAAYAPWEALAKRRLPVHAQWICARAGLLLFRQYCKNADLERASMVYRALQAFDSPMCRKILVEAKRHFQKQLGEI